VIGVGRRPNGKPALGGAAPTVSYNAAGKLGGGRRLLFDLAEGRKMESHWLAFKAVGWRGRNAPAADQLPLTTRPEKIKEK